MTQGAFKKFCKLKIYTPIKHVFSKHNHRALNRNDFECQRKQRKIGLAVAWHFFSLPSDFPTQGPGTCDFMRALTSISVISHLQLQIFN